MDDLPISSYIILYLLPLRGGGFSKATSFPQEMLHTELLESWDEKGLALDFSVAGHRDWTGTTEPG